MIYLYLYPHVFNYILQCHNLARKTVIMGWIYYSAVQGSSLLTKLKYKVNEVSKSVRSLV